MNSGFCRNCLSYKQCVSYTEKEGCWTFLDNQWSTVRNHMSTLGNTKGVSFHVIEQANIYSNPLTAQMYPQNANDDVNGAITLMPTWWHHLQSHI